MASSSDIAIITFRFNYVADYVRNAVYGRDVREIIATGFENCRDLLAETLWESDIATVAETKTYLGIE